ncbi:MAG: very short patch repair endonuclease [Candidatus Methanofastidiosum sp.]|nr:very short patch repair endonuclease [Methanofastidiosum sp.]
MTDNLTEEQRKKNMQNIRSKNTKPEKIIMKELKRRKIYFAKHVDKITGKPDIVFRRKKVAVFIDSDFWHGHPERFIMPKTNTKYWKNKIDRNIKRDKEVTKILTEKNWKVIRLWEYDIKHSLDICMNKILKAIDKI